MDAIVLVGGLGKRLKSVVSDLPKPMADINGRPFLQYLLDFLAAQKVEAVALCVSYKRNAIQDHFGDSYGPLKLTYSIEEQPCGTGGGIKKAVPLLKGDSIFVLNGDSFFDIDLARLRRFHDDADASLTIALRVMDDCGRYGAVEVDGGGRVVGFKEKQAGVAGFINGGIYVLQRRLFEMIHTPSVFSFEKDIMEKHFKAHSFYGIPFDEYFIDIGIPEDYERATRQLPSRLEPRSVQ